MEEVGLWPNASEPGARRNAKRLHLPSCISSHKRPHTETRLD